jgi:hypothetical protein
MTLGKFFVFLLLSMTLFFMACERRDTAQPQTERDQSTEYQMEQQDEEEAWEGEVNGSDAEEELGEDDYEDEVTEEDEMV